MLWWTVNPDAISAHDVSIKILHRFRAEHSCPHHIFFKGVLCAVLLLGSLAHLVYHWEASSASAGFASGLWLGGTGDCRTWNCGGHTLALGICALYHHTIGHEFTFRQWSFGIFWRKTSPSIEFQRQLPWNFPDPWMMPLQVGEMSDLVSSEAREYNWLWNLSRRVHVLIQCNLKSSTNKPSSWWESDDSDDLWKTKWGNPWELCSKNTWKSGWGAPTASLSMSGKFDPKL